MTLVDCPSEIAFTVVRDDAGARLSIAGELDLMWVPALTEQLTRLELYDAPIIIDLVELTFIDCVGMAALRTAARRAEDRRSGFKIINACRAVRRVFELTGNSTLIAADQLVRSLPAEEVSDV